jgi:hypothetical protein
MHGAWSRSIQTQFLYVLLFVCLQVKKDRNTGNSMGFGFLHFASCDVQQRVLMKQHMIGDRWCEVRIPNSKVAGVCVIPSF